MRQLTRLILKISPLKTCLFIALFGSITEAAPPPVVPGFPYQQAFVPGQLYTRHIGIGRTTNIIYHNGVFYSNNVGGAFRSEWRFTDPADITSFSLISTEDNMPPMTEQGNHAHKKSGDYAGGGLGMHFRRVSPGVNANNDGLPLEDLFDGEPFTGRNIQVERPPVNPGEFSTSSTRLYYPWSVPFNWLQYAAVPGSGRIWRADQLISDWEPLADHGVSGNGILVGNLLFIISDASMLGVLAYDISPCLENPGAEPRLLDKFSGPVGAYIGTIWENYLILSGADEYQVFIIDYSDPTDLQLVRTLDLSQPPGTSLGQVVAYVQTQDEYIFTHRQKVNMETFETEVVFDEVGSTRPSGSLSGNLGTSQYMLPVGHLLVSGAYSTEGADGVGVWCHQSEPDTRGPYVGYHIPRPGQSDYPPGAPISLIIAETLESYTIINGDTLILRPQGGDPVDCWTSFAHDGVLTITPKEYLTPDTSYVVEIVDGGIKDAAGNGIQGYSFSFSTGNQVSASNTPPEINAIHFSETPANTNDSVQFNIDASDADSDSLEYRINFGDGSGFNQWSLQARQSHRYTRSDHYSVKVQVRDIRSGTDAITVSDVRTITVSDRPVETASATHSAPIALDSNNRKIWVVNPDNNSVARLDADSAGFDFERSLRTTLGLDGSIHPKSIATTSSGAVWVACRDADRICILAPDGSLVTEIETGYGTAPVALAIAANGSDAYVVLQAGGANEAANGQLVRYSTNTYAELGRVELGKSAHALALSRDGSEAFITQFITPDINSRIWWVDTASMSLNRELPVAFDFGRNERFDRGGSDGNGTPNYLAAIAIPPTLEDSPARLWYTGIKASTMRGLFFDQASGLNGPLQHDSTIRSMVGRFDLSEGFPREVNAGSPFDERLDIDNSDSPSAIAFSPLGDYAFVALQGNNNVAVYDRFALRDGAAQTTTWRIDVGHAPQGLLFDPSTNSLWVKNFMSRDVSIIQLEDFLQYGRRSANEQRISTVQNEHLKPDVLAGKQTFYFAGNSMDGHNEMSFEGYISCASCHIEGQHDGRVWDFTQRGEGLRNTTDLRGRAGLAHGNVHWTGNFDEVEDFVLDIVNEFKGNGFLDENQSPNPPLGLSNAGLNEAIDQLADYVESLDIETLPKSPHRQTDGSMTTGAIAGATIFQEQSCITCHSPSTGFTDSLLGATNLHDVGTLRSSSGNRLGNTLTGIDTPTLLGLWSTAPYFHDGSAEDIDAVFTTTGGTIYEAEVNTAVAGGITHVPAGNPTFDLLAILWESSAQGSMVYLTDIGGTITWSQIDGGSGGLGALELRILPPEVGTIRVTVNGSHSELISHSGQNHTLEWHRLRLEDVPLNAGMNNTIVVQRVSGGQTETSFWGSLFVDNLMVSTPDHLSRAQAHRRALALSSSDYQDLLDYILQLDGRDAEGLLPATAIELWRATHFGTRANSGTSADNADSDGDNIVNLLEFSLGGNPLAFSGQVLPQIQIHNGPVSDHLELHITRSPDASDLQFIVEVSSDLIHWESGNTDVATITDTSTLLVARDRTPMSQASKRFIRLRVLRP